MNTRQTIFERYLHPICSAVTLAVTPTWKLRVRQQMHYAERKYAEAMEAIDEAELDCRNSAVERSDATYWEGRRDALRAFLPNTD